MDPAFLKHFAGVSTFEMGHVITGHRGPSEEQTHEHAERIKLRLQWVQRGHPFCHPSNEHDSIHSSSVRRDALCSSEIADMPHEMNRLSFQLRREILLVKDG